ncbi:MAG TPA: IPT/TIG domain-containing protein [Anaerolineae bacterium]|nr:IPT/TIG domain-containing protein [Anaerolineae bacterium]
MKLRPFAIVGIVLSPIVCLILLFSSLQGAGLSSRVWAANAHANAPSVNEIVPNSAPNDLDTSIIITGSDFTAQLSGTQIMTVPVVSIGKVILPDVGWIDSTTLTATVPWGVDVGVYTVVITNPDGTAVSSSHAFTVTQGLGVWTSDGPYGGAVTTILVHPVTPTVLYASVQAPYSASGIGLFRSVDGGLNWTMIFADIGNQFHSADLSTPAPAVVYVDKWGAGLYRSNDGGDNWVALSMPGNVGGDINPYAHPTNSQVVYATANCVPACGGVYRSDDQGTQWITLTTGLTDTQVTALAFDPGNPQIMYAGTTNGNVFRSANGGNAWNFIGQPDQYISNLAVNPFGGHEVWAAGADSNGHWGYLWKYTGGNWMQILPGTAQQNNATSIAFSRAVSGTMWIGALDGSLSSSNDGDTWAFFGGTSQSINALTPDPSDAAIFYLGSNGGGIFKTVNAGVSWNTINEGLAGIYPTGLAINPANTAIVYATAHGPGTFKSNNGGSAWIGLPSDNAWARSPVVDPSNPQRVYIGTTNGVYITENDGQTWETIRPDPPAQYLGCCRVEMLSLLPAGQPGHLIMGVGFIDNSSSSYSFVGGGIYTSTDFGETWGYVDVSQVISPVEVLAATPGNPAVIYAGTGNCCANQGSGVWKSTDGGATWSSSGLAGLQITGLAVDPIDSQTIYATSLQQFYVSSNGGLTWTLRATQDYGMDSLLVEPTTPPTLYQYGWRGVIRSVDGGFHWDRAVGSLGYAKIGAMATATAQGRVLLYVGTGGGTLTGMAQMEQGHAASGGNVVNGGVYRNTVRALSRRIFLPLIRR